MPLFNLRAVTPNDVGAGLCACPDVGNHTGLLSSWAKRRISLEIPRSSLASLGTPWN